jgi:hypothetical protein
LAIAADAELRRRNPDQRIEPLHSTEPGPATQAERDELILALGAEIGEMAHWIQDLAAQRKAFREKLEERQGLMIRSENPDQEHLGGALPHRALPDREAILQPPKPQIWPAAKILQTACQRDASQEAAT